MGHERYNPNLLFCFLHISGGHGADELGWAWDLHPGPSKPRRFPPALACLLPCRAPISFGEHVLASLRIENVVKYFSFGGAPFCLCSAPRATRRALNFTALWG